MIQSRNWISRNSRSQNPSWAASETHAGIVGQIAIHQAPKGVDVPCQQLVSLAGELVFQDEFIVMQSGCSQEIRLRRKPFHDARAGSSEQDIVAEEDMVCVREVGSTGFIKSLL